MKKQSENIPPGAPGPPKIPKSQGGQFYAFTTRGREYTQMKGLDEDFPTVTLVLTYDVIMTS